jgi:hypothetical protein
MFEATQMQTHLETKINGTNVSPKMQQNSYSCCFEQQDEKTRIADSPIGWTANFGG